MTNILILGANGQIARVATDLFLERADARLTLYLRNARRLKISGHSDRLRVVEGDVMDSKTLEAAMSGQDVVYANLDGELEQQARGIVKTMQKLGIKRLIFINGSVLDIVIFSFTYSRVPIQQQIHVSRSADL
jgi:saccharopine dehydrogenase-like NADP-dependent oxidoreductase